MATSTWAGATEGGKSEVETERSDRVLVEDVAGDDGSAEGGGDDGAVEATVEVSREGEEGGDDDDDGDD
ncbi:hypothetical protein, partial [Salmonella enterica]|uniref:hypothetical protein n=1 Tax=Salmonella enterica TaxID=28901 RepID=UPI0039E94213